MPDIYNILKGCMENDSRSQKLFYERYLKFALKISFRYVHSFENAADAANDAFVKIFRNIHKFEIRDADKLEAMLMGWVKRIVVNASIDYMSKENLTPQNIALPDGVWNKPGTEQSGENNISYKELMLLVRKLSPGYRAVFNLYVIDGCSHAEIAAMLGISVGTSKSNLSKAKDFLQKHFIKDNNGNALCFT